MTSPRKWALATPDKPAIVMAGIGEPPWGAGHTITYRQLDARSNQLAHLLRHLGLTVGDHIALFSENHPRYLEACWAADRSGLYYTAINSHLTAEELAYIVDDCDARIVITSAAKLAIALDAAASCPKIEQVLVFPEGLDASDELGRAQRYDEAIAGFPTEPVAGETNGASMLYSSGTTGRPKGVMRPLSGLSPDDRHPFEQVLEFFYQYDSSSIYLSPAPLYHAAPLGFNMTVLRLGGTVVLMERFDPLAFLRLVDEYEVTHTQVVPTMFVRLVKLGAAERGRFHLQSLRSCVHAAAPCPVSVKAEMIEWWGPRGVVITEYYGGTELNGLTFIFPDEWLQKRGSVGKAIQGRLRILDDRGNELGPGEVGTVYFAEGGEFAYYKDDAKTASTLAPDGSGATTLGDVGYVDEDGYLFLTDRKAFMVISGGVNIYPQEVENVLITHPKVTDVAVFGLPDDDLGEIVHAVVQPAPGAERAGLEAELLEFCRAHLARFKIPRAIDFDDELPRLDTGKLYKTALRARYLTKS